MKKITSFFLLLIFLTPAVSHSFCFEQAAQQYGVSAQLLWAMCKVESNFDARAINYNGNGSFDYGAMQINSHWYKKLGNRRWQNLNDACYNVRVGAWILSQCVAHHGYTWEAVGCYNASSKPKGAKYANKVYKVLTKARPAG